MAKSIKEEGFTMLVGRRAMQSLMRENRDAAGLLCDYSADRAPDHTFDAMKSYGVGSEIVTKDGRYFKCIDARPNKAKWLFLSEGAMIIGHTDDYEVESLERPEEEADKEAGAGEPEVAADEGVAIDYPKGNDTPEEEEKEKEADKEEEDDAGDENPKTEVLPEDIPYRYQIEQSGATTAQLRGMSVAQIADLSYMNPERAAKIHEYLHSGTENEEAPRTAEYGRITDALSVG